MQFDNLKGFAKSKNILLPSQTEIIAEAAQIIASRYNFDSEAIKRNFDQLLDETAIEIYSVYLRHEQLYGSLVIKEFVDHLIEQQNPNDLREVGIMLGSHFSMFDKFFLSLAQGRKSRAGGAFENIHHSLFKIIDYPFDEQPIIDGKPDFILPSKKHYDQKPMDCIIFTAKRTLRERWRQIVTEGTRGLGFFLATIDEKISANQLADMLHHRIYVVCPQRIKDSRYPTAENVISFSDFFIDHVDPAVQRWRRNGVI